MANKPLSGLDAVLYILRPLAAAVVTHSIEFCSAHISHLLAIAYPDNIALCPLTISVYVLRAEPDQVRIPYRTRPADRDRMVAPRMSADQIAETQRLAREWRKEYSKRASAEKTETAKGSE